MKVLAINNYSLDKATEQSVKGIALSSLLKNRLSDAQRERG